MIGVYISFHWENDVRYNASTGDRKSISYCPQRRVQRLNGTLKLKIQKAVPETGRPWIALYYVRTMPQRRTGLSPFEILVGQVPGTGLYFPQ